MKLKVGDKVKIREDLKEKTYKGLRVDEKMLQYRGKTGVITDYDTDDKSFQIDIDNGHWCWNKRMVEPLTFPRMMEVSDHKDFVGLCEKREVFFHEQRAQCPYLTIDAVGHIMNFKYAREITPAPEKDDCRAKMEAKAHELFDKANEMVLAANNLIKKATELND